MRYYPLLLDLHGIDCLVVGAGEVGLRKIQGLLPCRPARLRAVDPAPASAPLRELLAAHKNFTYMQQHFAVEHLQGSGLVFACTAQRQVNAQIGLACARQGIWCNMTDDPDSGTFTLPASITRGDLTISVSTSGASPALARIIRADLEQRYGQEYAALTALLAEIRPALLALGQTSAANRDIFRALAEALPDIFKTKNRAACQSLLQTLLPAPLHPRIGEWCDHCFQTL